MYTSRVKLSIGMFKLGSVKIGLYRARIKLKKLGSSSARQVCTKLELEFVKRLPYIHRYIHTHPYPYTQKSKPPKNEIKKSFHAHTQQKLKSRREIPFKHIHTQNYIYTYTSIHNKNQNEEIRFKPTDWTSNPTNWNPSQTLWLKPDDGQIRERERERKKGSCYYHCRSQRRCHSGLRVQIWWLWRQ